MSSMLLQERLSAVEDEFADEFTFLRTVGRLIKESETENWDKVLQHCKTECKLALSLAWLLKLSDDDTMILAKAALLHDWHKRFSKELKTEITFEEEEEISKSGLIKHGYSDRIVDIAHSVGHLTLDKSANSPDLLKKAMHFIDDITSDDRIVSIDDRVKVLEQNPDYAKLNEEGRGKYGGMTTFEKQREVGYIIQHQLEETLRNEGVTVHNGKLHELLRSIVVEPVWKEIFLQLATRALIQVHNRYSVWELGQSDLSVEHFRRLNQGYGIYFAPEEHLTDAISQQIIETGLWKEHTIEKLQRSFLIDREFMINIPQDIEAERKTYYVDIVFRKRSEKNSDDTKVRPVLIEAKRYRLVTINHESACINEGEIQKATIEKDIKKLKRIWQHVKTNGIHLQDKLYEDCFCYLLIWGKGDKSFNIQSDLIDKLESGKDIDLANMVINRVPMEWDNTNLDVKSFLWISLIPLKDDGLEIVDN
ncbi:MAG: hypothetical protein JNM88_19885 [Chitinophagaceae bacterium]|nr:hypothetical protein [Chitinophagaceae bacterium]